MASTTPPDLLFARLALAVYGVRLGSASMQLALDAARDAGGVEPVMDGLLARDLGAMDASQVAVRLVDDIGISGGARSEALARVQAQLQGVPAATRGAAVVGIVDALAALTADPTWGIWAARFNAEVAAALQAPPAKDSYLRAAAAEGRYAPWIEPDPGPEPDPGGGGDPPPPGDGGGDPPPPGGGGTDPPPGTGGGTRTLDLIAVSDRAAAAIGDDATADEGLEVLLSSTPAIRVHVDVDGDRIVGAHEVTSLPVVLGVDDLLTGAANDRVTLTQGQLRVLARIDLGGQQDSTRPGFLREGGDSLTLVHADIDRNGVADADDAPWRPTLTVIVEPGNRTQVVATGGALEAQIARYQLAGVERLDLQQAATSDRFDDRLDLTALPGATFNQGPARTIGAGAGGGAPDPTRLDRIDAATLDAGGVAAQRAVLGVEALVIAGAALIERVVAGAGDERVIVGADAGLQSVGGGAFAPTAGAVRTHFDRSLAEPGGLAPTPSSWEDQGLYRFDLGGGVDTLDYHAETAGVTVAVATSASGPDRVHVGAPGAGGGRVDLATGVEVYFGGRGGANWIDLAASAVPTTLAFSRPRALAEPDGDTAAGAGPAAELRADDGSVLATFVDRLGAGVLPAAQWLWVQGGDAAETVLLGDDDLAAVHHLQLGRGANRVDHAAASFAIVARIGAVDTMLASLPQGSTVAADVVEQLLGDAPVRDRLAVVGSRSAGDTLDVTLLAHGSVVRTEPALPTRSQVDPAFHLVDLAAGRVVESVFGEFVPAGAVGLVRVRAFETQVTGFENASNAADADAVHLLGDGGVNALTGGTAADLLWGGRGIAGSGAADVGFGLRGDRLAGGAGGDSFLYLAEAESPGGSVAGGQQRSSDFGASPANVVNARDTIADFASGSDRLAFQIDDGHDAVRVSGSLPATLAGTANAALPVTLLLAPGAMQIDIPRDAGAAEPAGREDNYAVDTPGATVATADVVLRVRASAGADVIDASAGLSAGALAAPASDALRVEVVYSAPSQSQAAGVDQIVHFRPGSDRIDLSFLQLPRFESLHAGNGVAYDRNGDNAVDAIAGGLIRVLGSAPTLAINSPAPNLFIDGGVWRPLVAQAVAAPGGHSTTLFVDADGDGHYAPDRDMVIALVGVDGLTDADFVVDRYGGGWDR